MCMFSLAHQCLSQFLRDMSQKSKNHAAETNRQSNHANSLDIPWLEWRDSDLNNEKWGIPKTGPDGLFLDAERVEMPRSIEVHQWIRAKDLEHLTGPLTVYTTITEYLDLIINNKHLLHSEFVRWFISALTNLQYCGREGLEISGENSNFIWVNRHNPWHGWMHVYSLNKAGKGAQHRPVINPNGKYIVRLHYIGCWRRILVDDTIPVDEGGRPLLPCTSNNFELWPMLLAKALLKIASQTWILNHEIVDFHPIACLTGWTCLTQNIKHLTFQDKWDLLIKYSKRFEWPSQTTPENAKNNVTMGKSKENLRPLTEIEKPQPIVLFLFLNDLRELESEAVPGLSPCWDHVIHIVQSRDIPLDPKDVKEPLAKWKMHRWLKWAISQNIIDPADYFVPIRFLKIISPLKKCDESVVYVYHKYEEELPVLKRHNKFETNQLNKFMWIKTGFQKISNSNPNPSNAIKEEAIKANANTEDGQWIDFNKLAPYITEVYLFYKLEYFQYSTQIMGDILKANEIRKATKEKKEKKDAHDWFSQSPKSRIKPLYLFSDSLEKKFFLINLCIVPKKKNMDLNHSNYLILEKYNWFLGSNQSNQSITVSTTGTKSTIVELEAGRQLLRIYRNSESNLIVMSSNTAFYFGNRAIVQQMMTTESERIKQMSIKISDNLRAAYQSFGTEDYAVMLKNYYRSYMPNLQEEILKIDKSIRTLIHDSFMEEQIRLISKTFSHKEYKNILHALSVFFLNPNISLTYFDLMTNVKTIPNLITMQDFTRLKNDKDETEYIQKVIIIQSFFKMARIRSYKNLHNPDHPLHVNIYNELQKVSNLFDLSVTSQLLRNVINRHNLRDLYPCSEDFIHVLDIQEFRGVLGNVKQEQWFPIAKLIMNPKPEETVLAAFELLIDLPRVALRVFNNHDQHELSRTVNHVNPIYYVHLPSGYTIFAYGRSGKEGFKELNWMIHMLTIKGMSTLQLNEFLSLDSKPFKLVIEELVGIYVPNIKNYISRWIVRAMPGSIVSIRLITSYNLTDIRIKIIDEKGDIIIDTKGQYTILLPILTLRSINDKIQNRIEVLENAVQNKSSYYVEAFVLNNSWPLTNAEWTVVNQIKMKNVKNLKKKTQSGNKASSRSNWGKKETMKHENDQALESPYWIFQVVTNTLKPVEIYQDKRREEEIMQLKEFWWSKSPDRYERGKQLREAFLNMYASKIEPEEAPSNEKINKDMLFCLPKEHRTLKPPQIIYLPPLDLTKYMQDDIAKYRMLKTKQDDEKLKNQHLMKIEDSQRNYSNYLDKLIELNEQLQHYTKFFQRWKENFQRTRMLVNTAYKSRKAYIDSLVTEKVKAKEKKGKKD